MAAKGEERDTSLVLIPKTPNLEKEAVTFYLDKKNYAITLRNSILFLVRIILFIDTGIFGER